LIKMYGKEPESEKRYSPARCTGTEKRVVQGNPDIRAISTSYVERQNLTMRMCVRRFTRLTNAFSKKLDNHILALALYFMHYNFARPHKSLSNPYPMTPAMVAGISNHVWTVEEIVSLKSKWYATTNSTRCYLWNPVQRSENNDSQRRYTAAEKATVSWL